MTDDPKIAGGCLCGRIRYEATGEPLFGALCYCRDCQRVSGTGNVPTMGVHKGDFFVTGDPSAYRNVGASGHMSVRNFCPDCGSLLFGTPEVAPWLVTIYAGSLDNPEIFSASLSQYVRSRLPWDTSGAGLPEFLASSPAPEN